MANPTIAQPATLTFDGGDAANHYVDAAYLGQSLQGTAKLYNSVTHFWYQGQIPSRYVPEIRIAVGPPTDGCLTYVIWFMVVHGRLALYPQLLFELADLAIPHFIKAIFAKKAGRPSEMEKALDVIQELARQNTDLAKTVHGDSIRDKDRLFGLVEKLTDSNQQALREIAAPVGPSVKTITHFRNIIDGSFTIDEPIADAFRAKADVEVGDLTTYRARFIGVDKAAGSCRLEIEGLDKLVRGKITDPGLAIPMNPYTHALDSGTTVLITGKPVLKEGEIKTLYISDVKGA